MRKYKLSPFMPFATFVGFVFFVYLFINLPANLRSGYKGAAVNLDATPFLNGLEIENKMQFRKGEAMVIEVFASWCGACMLNHRQLMEIAPQINMPVYGVAVADSKDAVHAWLARHGNPFKGMLFTTWHQHLVKIGVTSLPETFIVDRNGKIIFKFKGVVNIQTVKDAIHQTIARSS